MRTRGSRSHGARIAVTLALLSALSLTAGPVPPAQALTSIVQLNGCVDDTGVWTSASVPLQTTLAPAIIGVGDTATMTATATTFALDTNMLKSRVGLSIRVAPTLAGIGTPDLTTPGQLLGQNALSVSSGIRFVSTNATPTAQTATGNATQTFWAAADGTIYTGTPTPPTNTTLTPVASLGGPLPLSDSSWVGTAGGQLSITEANTPPANLVTPGPADLAVAPSTTRYSLNGSLVPFATVACWPGGTGPVGPPPPPPPPGAPSLNPQTVPLANVGAPTVVRTLAGATGTAGVNPASVIVTIAPKHGSLSVDPTTGNITYIPFTTSLTTPADTFTVIAAAPAPNATLVSAPTVETITAITANPLVAPTLVPNIVSSANVGSATVIHPLFGATGNAGVDPASVKVTVAPLHGTAVVDTLTGDITYTPSATSLTTPADTFTITAAAPPPNATLVSAPTVETITAITANPLVAPTLVPKVVPVANVGNPSVIHTLTGATGNAGIDPASVKVTVAPLHGTALVDTVTGNITYTPTTTSLTTPADTFTVTVAAPAPHGTLVSAATVEAITTISTSNPTGLLQGLVTPLSSVLASTLIKARPTCTDSSATLGLGQSTVIDVLATCTSPTSTLTPASVQIVTPPTAGGAAIQPTTGAIVYSSTSTTATTDSFTFRVVGTDGVASNIAKVSIQILGVTCLSGCTPVATTGVPVVLSAQQTGDLINFVPVTLNGDAKVGAATINPVYVYNGSNSLGWTLTATVSDFLGTTSGKTSCDVRDRLCIPSRNLGWQPSAAVVSSPVSGPAPTVAAGPGLTNWLHPELSPVNGTNPLTVTPSVLCSSPAATSIGTFVCNAALFLSIPASAGAGVYVATLTLTLG